MRLSRRIQDVKNTQQALDNAKAQAKQLTKLSALMRLKNGGKLVNELSQNTASEEHKQMV